MKLLRRITIFLVVFFVLYLSSYWYLFVHGGFRTVHKATGLGDPVKGIPVLNAVFSPMMHLDAAWQRNRSKKKMVGTWQNAFGNLRVIVHSNGQCHFQLPTEDNTVLHATATLAFYEEYNPVLHRMVVYQVPVTTSDIKSFVIMALEQDDEDRLNFSPMFELNVRHSMGERLHRVPPP